MDILEIPRRFTIDEFTSACEFGKKISLKKSAWPDIAASENVCRRVRGSGAPIYGVNTGIGDLCDVIIPPEQQLSLQQSIVLSHACGGAPYFPPLIARGAVLLSINALSKGYSGVSPELVRTLVTLFNNDISPAMPMYGSLGASGDLIPLAHLGLLLIGKGRAYVKKKQVSASFALRSAGVTPYVFRGKDALGVINGTEALSSYGAFLMSRAEYLFSVNLHELAVLYEVLGGSLSSLDAHLSDLKPHKGQREVAVLLRTMLRASTLANRSRAKTQDAYVVRCAPQIDGAIKSAISRACFVLETEMNSVTDNPLFFSEDSEDEALSGGNFHAQEVAFALDALATALAALSKVTERRIERIVNKSLSGLTAFLTRSEEKPGAGLMILQYLAADYVAENVSSAAPASIQSISVSANQEDFVSMAMAAARKCENILSNTENVCAIFALALAQAMDIYSEKTNTPFSSWCHAARVLYSNVRRVSPPLTHDRSLGGDVARIVSRIRSRTMLSSPSVCLVKEAKKT